MLNASLLQPLGTLWPSFWHWQQVTLDILTLMTSLALKTFSYVNEFFSLTIYNVRLGGFKYTATLCISHHCQYLKPFIISLISCDHSSVTSSQPWNSVLSPVFWILLFYRPHTSEILYHICYLSLYISLARRFSESCVSWHALTGHSCAELKSIYSCDLCKPGSDSPDWSPVTFCT